VAFLREHPEVGVVCSDWDLIDEDGAIVGARISDVAEVTPGLAYISQTMRSGRSSIGIPGAMLRRSALGDIRLEDPGLSGFGDFVVWFQIAERYAVGHVGQRLWRWRQQRNSQSARTIESLTHDYIDYLTRYCDAHLRRWPDHAEMVKTWRADIDRYIFWALAFELALHCRRQLGFPPKREGRTLFEINDYDLGPEQVDRTRRRMRSHRRGAVQAAVWLAIELSMRCRFPWPLAWATYHASAVRGLLRLR
jgi:hypothetical protein